MRRIESDVLREWRSRRQERRDATSRTSSCTRFCSPACSRTPTRSTPRTSWLLAAAEKNLPIFVPGWEDSTLGNMYRRPRASTATQERPHRPQSGIEYMMRAGRVVHRDDARRRRSGSSRSAAASPATSRSASCRCSQQDLRREHVPLWGYFCQISDSTTSYGSYSGAVPNEKITWGKLGRRHAQVHHRVRRLHRRAAGVRLRAWLVSRAARG